MIQTRHLPTSTSVSTRLILIDVCIYFSNSFRIQYSYDRFRIIDLFSLDMNTIKGVHYDFLTLTARGLNLVIRI